MKSGDLARVAGVNVQTLRYYERRGLLPSPERTESGYRQYDAGDLRRLRFILRAKELGFTLTEVGELLDLRQDARRTADDVRERAHRKLRSTDAKIRDLRRIRRALEELVHSCDASGAPQECALIHAFEDEGT